MNKFKNWCKEHKVDLCVGGLSTIVVGVSMYVGYKYGIRIGRSQGVNKGASIVATHALVDSGLWDPNNLENKQWMFNWLKDQTTLTVNEELAKIITDQGGELAKTTVIAVTCRDLTH